VGSRSTPEWPFKHTILHPPFFSALSFFFGATTSTASISFPQPEQRAKIVENIIHSTMHPYFLRKSPEELEHFRPHYLHHMQMLADYCLREYIGVGMIN